MPYYIYRLFAKHLVKHQFYHYIGSTPDPLRRIRQHNGIIKGGAKCTSSKLECIENNQWSFNWLLKTTLDKNNALSLEFHMKHPFTLASGKKYSRYCVRLGNEIYKYRSRFFSRDINIMLKQIDVTIQYTIDKNQIINPQICLLLDDTVIDEIVYVPINYTILFIHDLTGSIFSREI